MSNDAPVSLTTRRGESVRRILEKATKTCGDLDAVMLIGLIKDHETGVLSFQVSWSQLSYLERIGILHEAIDQVQTLGIVCED